MRTAATPWDALLAIPVPQQLPDGVRTVLVVDGRTVTDPEQLQRHFGPCDSASDAERQAQLLARARQIAAAQVLTPEQRKARRRQYMRTYLQAWRERRRQAASAAPLDPEAPTPTPTHERNDR